MRERIGLIIPTRGDRPQFLARCYQQIKRQTLKPDAVYFIDLPPKSNEVDLVSRVKLGLSRAAMDGITQVFIIEDDDYYPAHYLERMQIPKGKVFAGTGWAWFYHIKVHRYELNVAPWHSPLFTTGFRIDALRRFDWPAHDFPYLDRPLWLYAYETYGPDAFHNGFPDPFEKNGPVGIKHGIGKCAGSGHAGNLEFIDQNFEWLESHIGAEEVKFYKSIRV